MREIPPPQEQFDNNPVWRRNFMIELATALEAGDLQLAKSMIQQLDAKPTVLKSDQLTPADNRLLEGLAEAVKGGRFQKFADKMDEYYRDADRADRTPRAMLYHHIGWLIGAVASSGIKIGGKLH